MTRENLRKWSPFVLLSVASLSILTWMGTVRVKREGDDTEYFFQTYQFSRKLELSGTKDDLYRFAEWFRPVATFPFDIEKIPEYPDGCGFTRVGDRYFPLHFGFYSVLAAGPLVVLRVFGLDDHRALLWTNGFLFVAMLWSVWFLLPYRRSTKMAVELCLIFSPATLYLTWVHAEVYLFAFVMMSLAASVAGKWKMSLLLASTASMQNQALGVYLVALVLLFLAREFAYLRVHRKIRWREWGLAFLAGLPSLVPVAYYMVHLHQPSLLGGSRFTSASFMSVWRGWSLFADLNQGMVAASSAVVVLFFCLVIRRIVTGKAEQSWMAIVTLVIGYAVSSIGNWNSACYGIMRYAAWIYAFVLVFVFANLEKLRKPVVRVGCLVLIVCVVAVQFCFLPKEYLKLRSVSRLIWDRLPALYSPEYDIFMSRVTGSEHSVTCKQDEDVFGLYCDSDGNVRKVLATYDNLMAGLNRYCLVDRQRFESIVEDARFKPSRLHYFNFSPHVLTLPALEMGQCVRMSERPLSIVLGKGFARPETWGVWSMSKTCGAGVMLPKASKALRLVVKAQAYVRTKSVDVYSGEQKLAEWKVSVPPMKPTDYSIGIPPELSGRMLKLRFVMDDAVAPCDVSPNSSDRRMLGIGLISMRLVDVE